MIDAKALEEVRHRVTLVGRVVDAVTQKVVKDADVTIIEMPRIFRQKLRYASPLAGLDKARMTGDGHFYFVDLPEGDYQLEASLPGMGKRYGTAVHGVTVKPDEKGDLSGGFAELALQPTAVSGKITGGARHSALIMARVQVRGSGEWTFSGENGEYSLSAIEPGKRGLQVLAQGYNRLEKEVDLAKPGDLATLDFHLVKAGNSPT
jgi:hypothetical protein